MWMTDVVRETKRQLRDKYGFKPTHTIGTPPFDEPVFAEGSIPDGEYPMDIGLDVSIRNGKFYFDRLVPKQEKVMQDDNTDCTKEASLADLIVPILQHKGGLGVEFAEQIGVYRQIDGSFVVFLKDSDDINYEEFKCPHEAAARFVKLREERQLGYDFEEEEAAATA
jgi:hypothetical protein